MKINRYTRASKDGKDIKCPECHECVRVYHFGWTALSCLGCHTMIEKNRWEVIP